MTRRGLLARLWQVGLRAPLSSAFVKFLIVGGVSYLINQLALFLLYEALPILPAQHTHGKKRHHLRARHGADGERAAALTSCSPPRLPSSKWISVAPPAMKTELRMRSGELLHQRGGLVITVPSSTTRTSAELGCSANQLPSRSRTPWRMFSVSLQARMTIEYEGLRARGHSSGALGVLISDEYR